MDEDRFNELKQFIEATVSQATAHMATKDDVVNVVTKTDFARLEHKIDDLGLKVDTISDALSEHLDDHETRITKLEQQAA